jgi:uncharacterized protein (DUF1810 family)
LIISAIAHQPAGFEILPNGIGRWNPVARRERGERYLDDPVLGARLRQVVNLMIHQPGKSALEILGSPDDLKFRSCLTLFRQAASDKDTKPKTIAPHK